MVIGTVPRGAEAVGDRVDEYESVILAEKVPLCQSLESKLCTSLQTCHCT